MDKNQQNWGTHYINLVSSYSSLFGILYTLYQLYQLREETSIIKTASEETRNEIFKLENFGDVTRGISLIHEIQIYLRSAKHELALIKVQEIKIIISEIISVSNHTYASDLKTEQLNLNLLTSSLEKEIDQGKNSIKTTQINGDLERIKDLLVDVRVQIKTSI
jgi:hypothetical protein